MFMYLLVLCIDESSNRTRVEEGVGEGELHIDTDTHGYNLCIYLLLSYTIKDNKQ